MRVQRELGVASFKTRWMEGDVKLAIRTDQIPHVGCRQRRGIVAEGQPVQYRFGPDARTEIFQRQR